MEDLKKFFEKIFSKNKQTKLEGWNELKKFYESLKNIHIENNNDNVDIQEIDGHIEECEKKIKSLSE